MNRRSSGSTLHLAAIGALLLGLLIGAALLLRRDTEARSTPDIVLLDDSVRTGSDPTATDLSEPDGSAPEIESVADAAPARVALDQVEEPERKARAKPKGPWITGRAVDPYGNAVKSAWITVSPWSQMAQTLAFEQMGMASSSSEAPRNAVATDAEGRFKIHRRKNLGAEIAVTARGIGFLVTRDRRVMTTGDREDVELEDLVLDPGVVLRGSVVNHLGEPVAGARVKRGKGAEGPLAVAAEVLEEMGMSGGGGVETDADGVFELPYEEAGLYTLTASHEEYPSVSASGETPSQGTVEGITLRFEAPARITGRITGMSETVTARLQRAATAPEDDDEQRTEKMFLSVTKISSRENGLDTSESAPFLGLFNGLGGDDNEVAADGSFEIGGLEPGAEYELHAFRRGGFMQRAKCTETVTASAPTTDLELPYDAGSTLTFRVVDARNSKPVESMKVNTAWEGDENFLADIMNSMGQQTSAESYPDGRVTLEELRPPSPESRCSLTIEAPGYTTLTKENVYVTKNGEEELGTIRLNPAPVLRVQVLEAGTGKPVSRVRVSFSERTTGNAFGRDFGNELEGDESEGRLRVGVGVGGRMNNVDLSEVMGNSVRGKTDANGFVELTVFPTSRGMLRLRSTRYAPKVIEDIVIVKNAGVKSMTETISRGAEVIVLVLDDKNQPVPGVPIQHESPEDLGVMDMSAKKTSKKGRVKYTRLAPGEHKFRVVEHGLDMGQGTIAVSEITGGDEGPDDWHRLQLADGSKRELRLDPPLHASLEGTVRSSEGALVGASVSLRPQGSDSNGIEEIGGAWGDLIASGGLKGRTNGDGVYSIDRIPVGDYSLVVRHPNRAVPSTFELKIGRGDNEFSPRLAGGSISGRVLDDAGQAISGATVRIRRLGTGMDMSDFEDMAAAFGGMMGDAGAERVTTGADGSYRFDGLPADAELQVSVRAEGHVPGTSEAVELGRDESEHDVDVKLTRGGSILVRVVGPETMFLQAIARYEGDDEGVDRRRSGFVSQGTAVIDGLHPGPWRVTLSPPRDTENPPEPTRVTVTPGTEVEVTIER